MKIQPNFIQKCLFTMALLVPSLLYAQVTKECFKARIQTPVKEVMNVHLTSSDTIPLMHLGTIYALSIDATIEQPREASFVRIVLEDTEGHNYLVAESDWFRNDTTTVQLSEYCEETAQLNGITPLRLKCYLTNASLQLTGIHTSSEMPKRGMMTKSERESVKTAQVQNVVERINEYNKKHRRLWKAAVTEISLLFYDKKELLYDNEGMNPYLNNMQYYAGGLYEIGTPHVRQRNATSPYVPFFDWRNRHGKNWLTPVKNQQSSGYCTAFAAVGMLESNMLLNYNVIYSDTFELDLSEQYVASYSGIDYDEGAMRWTPIDFLKSDGTIDEGSMPFVNSPNYTPPAIRPQGIEHVWLNEFYEFNLRPIQIGFMSESSLYDINANTPRAIPRTDLDLDTLKKYLITKGPGVCGYQNARPGTHSIDNSHKGGHSMTLVGYGTIVPDTSYILFNGILNNITFHSGDSIIGHTYWIYKNSWGKSWGHNGYMYIVYYNDDNWYMGEFAYFPKGCPVSNVNHSVNCEDLDGDGYFNWGIGPKPSHCPSWAADEPDGDDSDYTKGPMTPYGFIPDIIPDSLPQTIISTNQTFSSKKYLHGHCTIQSGAELIVQDEIQCYNGVQIIVKNNATLKIDGGVIKNVHLIVEAGGHLIIEDGGEVFCNPSFPFEIPLGALLDVSQGCIH